MLSCTLTKARLAQLRCARLANNRFATVRTKPPQLRCASGAAEVLYAQQIAPA